MGVTGLSGCAAALLEGTPKTKEGLVVTSVPALPPALKLNATAAGADVEDDEAKVNGAGAAIAGFTSEGVSCAAPKEKGEDLTSDCFFSWLNEKGANKGFGASSTGGGATAVVVAAELAFSDGPNEKADLTVSVEAAAVDGAEDSEPGRGPKVKGRGEGVDCGG